MENSFKLIIDQSKSALILLPVKPYFDQVAAGLSLYLAIRTDKEVSISSPSPMIVEFNRLVGVNKIAQELGNKNLIIRFEDYKASDIERVSYDIENGEFRLTVIPKPGVSAPQKEQAQLSYTGISSDTIFLIGGLNDSHFPALSSSDLAGAKLVHIGPRPLSLSSGKSVISFARPASSCSELMASLIKESGLKIDSDIATNLVLGIEEGSNKFSGSDVTAGTFQLFAELMKSGGKRLGESSYTKRYESLQSVPVQVPQRKDVKKEDEKGAPKDWLQPKIYKGTSIS
jgi:hypothetical protein